MLTNVVRDGGQVKGKCFGLYCPRFEEDLIYIIPERGRRIELLK
jgi:hypothetical protein